MRPRPDPQSNIANERLIGRAKAVLFLERVWPCLVLAASLAAVFVALSWLGLWLALPVRGLGALCAAAALVWVVAASVRLRWPARREAMARLDRDSGRLHRPFSTYADALSNAGSDPTTQALWEMHRRRVQQAAAATRVAPPAPRMAERDRYALRAAAVLILVAAAFVAGPDKAGRLASAFTWRTPDPASAGTRIDAWIDPPGYTGKPPVILMGQGDGAPQQGAVSVPVGSRIIVRASGASAVDVQSQGGIKDLPAKQAGVASGPGKSDTSPSPTKGLDRQLVLSGDGTLTVSQDGAALRSFSLHAVPDLPPRVTLSGVPRPDYRGSLNLSYTLEDDYGVVGAEARVGNPRINGQAMTGRTLVEAPKGPLALPPTPGGIGDAKTTLDLSDSPWAGATVTLTLTARDDAGNTGESKPVDLVLPMRPFTNPLARALVEQRRLLVFDPDHKERVQTALEALTLAPEEFGVPLGIHLGLHTAAIRLDAAKTDPALVEVADLLWAMALRIENGDLSQTEQDLRAAQKDLRDAMQRNASPEEMKRLTDNLRRLMDKFLSELAQKQDRTGNPQQNAQNQRNRTITDKDLKSMMDRLEQAQKNGDMAEAQRLLDQLSGIMNNLQSAQRGNAQSQATREMNRSMSDLDRMMREQGDVRDKTFREGNGQDLDQQGDDQAGADGQPPSDGQEPGGQQGEASGQDGSGQQPATGLGQLQRRQQALSRQLQQLQKRLRDLGMKGEQGFADAQEAMKQAENALGKGQNGVGDAVGAQGRALEGLQRGMNGLGQQMAQQGNQPGQGSGQAQATGDGDPMSEGDDTDPLGRPRQGRAAAQNNDLDVSGGLAARAARVLEELRRRLADPTRSQAEQDYLERLLNRY